MGSVNLKPTGSAVPILSAALLLGTAVGCSAGRESPVVATVVFGAETYTITGQATCANRPDGKLLIHASPGRPPVANVPFGDDGKRFVRVVLSQEYQIVVETAAFRFHDVRGFTDHANELWATKADDSYTINGRMPPEDGASAWQPFRIDVTCSRFENADDS